MNFTELAEAVLIGSQQYKAEETTATVYKLCYANGYFS